MKRLVLLTLLLSSLHAFGSDLSVGVITSSPPFSDMSQNGKERYFFGFSIDIMNGICKKLNTHCAFSPVTLENQLDALDNKRIDVLLLAKPYQPNTLNAYLISLPYMTSNVRFVTTTDSSLTESSLKNVKIGVVKSTFYDLLKQSPYGTNNQIIPFNSSPELLTALAQHQVDAILLNNGIAYNFVNNNMYHLKIISQKIKLGEGYGIVALPTQAALIKKINDALLSMQSDGTYISIYEKYYNSH